MKKLVLFAFILLFVFCAKKQTTVETEGLEEVIVFGEEETTISEEPVYPTAEEEPVMPPEEEEVIVPPPVEPVVEEEPSVEPMPAEEEELVEPAFEEEPAAEPVIEEEVAAVPPPIEEEPAMPMPPPAMEEEVYQPVETEPSAPARVFGFRIQIFASSTDKNASRVADDARTAFGNQSVYVDHIAPYYKVRIGDCLTREEAEALRKQALSLGFAGAFIVETMITP